MVGDRRSTGKSARVGKAKAASASHGGVQTVQGEEVGRPDHILKMVLAVLRLAVPGSVIGVNKIRRDACPLSAMRTRLGQSTSRWNHEWILGGEHENMHSNNFLNIRRFLFT